MSFSASRIFHYAGFDAKGCIAQLIHEIFAYSDAEIKRAHEIIRLFQEHASIGITGFVNERYGFIDEPIYKGALAVLAKSGHVI